jgi:Fe-S-cluster containining protein
MCCKVLEIDEFKKPAGRLCVHCELGKGCGIYEKRPDVCREYECLWLTERDLSVSLKPERIGALLMEDPDSDEYQAVCDPAKPMSWRHPLMFKHLVAKAKEGRVVVAKAGLNAWRIFETGEWGPWV